MTFEQYLWRVPSNYYRGNDMSTDRTFNLDTVRDVYDAGRRGDFDRVEAPLADDVVWIEPEWGPYGGTYHGPDTVVKHVRSERGAEWRKIAAEPDRFVVDGDTVVALATHAGTDERDETPVCDVWDLENGNVTRYRHYVGDIRSALLRRTPTERPEFSRSGTAPTTAATGDDPNDGYDVIRYWTDGRLIETYRRLSRDLRRHGFDATTVHRMGRVEYELRERDLDPDRIVDEGDERQ